MLRTRCTDQELSERGWIGCDNCDRMFDPEEEGTKGSSYATGDYHVCGKCAGRQ